MNKGNELLGFDWEESTEDFFNIEPKKETKDTVKTTVEEKPKDKEGEEEITEDDEPTFEAFEDVSKDVDNEGGDDNTGDTDKDKNTGPNSIYNDVYKDLKESGIFKHVEIEDDEELDADALYALQQEEYEQEVSARLQTWATNDLDEDARAFIKFKTQGGSTEEFFRSLQKSVEIPTGDIEEESYQDDIIRYQLREEGWDRDEIEERLSYLTEAGRKQKVAEKYQEKVKEKETKNKQLLLQQAESNKINAKKEEDKFRNTINTVLSEKDEINGFKITKEDKTRLLGFLTKKEHKVSDTRSVTGIQKKLADTFQDPEKLVLLAKLLDNDFDMSDFEKSVKTKTTRKVKSNLEQRKSLRPTNSGSSLEGSSSLADLF